MVTSNSISVNPACLEFHRKANFLYLFFIIKNNIIEEEEEEEEEENSREKLGEEIQKLVIPHSLKIEDRDWKIIWENSKELNKLGFNLAKNKEILAVPKLLVNENLDKIFAGF